MLATRTFFAAIAVATVFGLAAPALAGEGSPDIDHGPYGSWRDGPNYPLDMPYFGFAVPPAYRMAPPWVGGASEPEGNVGYFRQRRVIPHGSYGDED